MRGTPADFAKKPPQFCRLMLSGFAWRRHERIMLHSLQSMLSVAFCAVGAVIIVIGNRQFRIRDIDRIPIISPRAKHVIGIFLILVAVVVFVSQFVVGARKGGPPSLRRPSFGLTELHDPGATDAMRYGWLVSSSAKTPPA
jgi:hypothetical protein